MNPGVCRGSLQYVLRLDKRLLFPSLSKPSSMFYPWRNWSRRRCATFRPTANMRWSDPRVASGKFEHGATWALKSPSGLEVASVKRYYDPSSSSVRCC